MATSHKKNKLLAPVYAALACRLLGVAGAAPAPCTNQEIVLEAKPLEMDYRNNNAVLRFGLQGFKDYYLEANNNLTTTNWVTVGREPGATHSDLHTMVDTNATNATRFYRVREVPIEF